MSVHKPRDMITAFSFHYNIYLEQVYILLDLSKFVSSICINNMGEVRQKK